MTIVALCPLIYVYREAMGFRFQASSPNLVVLMLELISISYVKVGENFYYKYKISIFSSFRKLVMVSFRNKRNPYQLLDTGWKLFEN